MFVKFSNPNLHTSRLKQVALQPKQNLRFDFIEACEAKTIELASWSVHYIVIDYDLLAFEQWKSNQSL